MGNFGGTADCVNAKASTEDMTQKTMEKAIRFIDFFLPFTPPTTKC